MSRGGADMIGRMCIMAFHTLRVIPCHETSSVKNYINVIYKHAKMTCKILASLLTFLSKRDIIIVRELAATHRVYS